MTNLCRGGNVGEEAALPRGRLPWRLFLGTVLFLLACSVVAENQSRLERFEFDIPRTTRVMALHEVSRQADLLVAYLSANDAEEESLVGPVKGRLTVDEVLNVILRSSELTSRWVEDTMVSVEPRPQSDVSTDSPPEAIVRTLPHSTDFDPLRPHPEEVLVLGWPLRDLTLSVPPVVVMERDDLDAIGAPTLADALRYLSQSAFSRPEGYRSSGAQYAEMRGLGPDTALVLINGRRALPSANSLSSSAFDLNTIPVPAVERIEFLLDSAAAAYGSDAIGGVINIVLRDKVERPTLEVRYGGADGGGEQKRVTLSAGLNKDRFHGAVVFDYFDLGIEIQRIRNVALGVREGPALRNVGRGFPLVAEHAAGQTMRDRAGFELRIREQIRRSDVDVGIDPLTDPRRVFAGRIVVAERIQGRTQPQIFLPFGDRGSQ